MSLSRPTSTVGCFSSPLSDSYVEDNTQCACSAYDSVHDCDGSDVGSLRDDCEGATVLRDSRLSTPLKEDMDAMNSRSCPYESRQAALTQLNFLSSAGGCVY